MCGTDLRTFPQTLLHWLRPPSLDLIQTSQYPLVSTGHGFLGPVAPGLGFLVYPSWKEPSQASSPNEALKPSEQELGSR